jgi:hypothetical protein
MGGKHSALRSTRDFRHHLEGAPPELDSAAIIALERPVKRTRDNDCLPVRLLGCATTALMCRNITTLRGLEPAATPEEIEAAARQFVRKVSGVTTLNPRITPAFEQAVDAVAAATTELLGQLPPRRQPPPTLPPLRRIQQEARTR